METPLRSIAKAATWQALGLAMMTLISWVVTGSVAAGGAIAVLGAAVGTVTYVFHERLWAHVRWGRLHTNDAAPPRPINSTADR
nr:DUF2061 domain-containing protein [Tropicimonas marinistellae]